MNTDKIYAEQLTNEYAPKDTSKVIALRKLDAKAKLPAVVFAYTFDIIAALITGLGMCLSMGVIGGGTEAMFILGVILGVIGLFAISVNYPIYKKLLARGKHAADGTEKGAKIRLQTDPVGHGFVGFSGESPQQIFDGIGAIIATFSQASEIPAETILIELNKLLTK